MKILQTYLNRIIVGVTFAVGLGGALLPALANLDLTSTVGLIAGLGTVLGVVTKFLTGWQAHEARVADPTMGFNTSLGAPEEPKHV